MKQIYVNTTEKVYLRIYKDGVLTDADVGYDPTYTITIIGSSATPRTGTAIHEDTGIYSVLTELAESEAEAVLKVDWEFTAAAQAGTRTDYISVVTPYANFYDIKDLAPASATDAEIESAEMFGRYLINAVTGQSFGQYVQTVKVRGNNQAVLVLPNRIIRLDQVDVNDETVYTRDPEYNNFGRTLSITDTNFGIRAVATDNLPSWYVDVNYPTWEKESLYSVNGLYGWDYVPDEIEFCAKELAGDYFCKEISWKKKFVDQINASDWRIVFNDRQYQETSNLFVDKILNKYKSVGMVLI